MTEPTRDPDGDTALVLFSGGQDSATCLAWALARFSRVETMLFRLRFKDDAAAERTAFVAGLDLD